MYAKIGSALVLFAMVCLLSNLAYSENLDNRTDKASESTDSITSIFGCDKYDAVFHCDLFRNAYSGFDISSTSKVIANMTKTPMYVEGKFGPAVFLNDRYSEYIDIPRIQPYETPNFTISFWIKSTNGTPQFAGLGHIVTLENRENKNGWSFTANNNENRTVEFKLSNSDGQSVKSKGIPFSNNTFTHVAATFNGSIINMYKDGRLFETINYTGKYEPEHELPIHIGSDSSCDSCQQFKGIMDDLQIYNKSLTEDQIQSLYINPASISDDNQTHTLENNLVGHWTFDSTLSDTSKYRNFAQMYTPLTSMVEAPDGRIFVSEKNTGNIRVMVNESILERPLLHVNDSYVDWEQGMLGLAIDPDFNNNHYLYLYYTAHNNDGIPFNKVIKIVENNNIASHIETILDNIPASHGYHSGGAMSFGPDGKLYITIGDATEHIYAQSLVVPIGKVLRINTDGSFPKDNPYPDSPVYTLGHRNMFGIGFSFKDGIGIVTENGDAIYDEINILTKGGNYGFPTLQQPNVSPMLANSTLDIKPVRSFWKTIGPTQVIFYEGNKFPSMNNKFLFGTFTGDIYSVGINNKTNTITSEEHNQINHFPYEPTIGITQTDSGDIYYGSYHLYKIESINNEDKKQILFPIIINHSSDTIFEGLQISKLGYLLLDTHKEHNEIKSFHKFNNISLEIPKILIPKIGKVNGTLSIDGHQDTLQNVTYSVANSTSTNNFVTLSYPDVTGKVRIGIYDDHLK